MVALELLPGAFSPLTVRVARIEAATVLPDRLDIARGRRVAVSARGGAGAAGGVGGDGGAGRDGLAGMAASETKDATVSFYVVGEG